MTSIEWLIKQLKERGYAGEFPPHLLFEQAKEMHKQEIIDAIEEDVFHSSNKTAEQYYQETFKKD
jgi:hypothetical protein